ncbi:CCA tRNA nucleotidyltransferase [Candidatus Peregrinibacteria bacterium]|nr:CCA tRNA nucleotidyltransferase [Candidatus Peregrinibacteria bacterium]
MKIHAIDIVKSLQKQGHQAYFAGGCVRDMLLGIHPKDFDIVTSALPDQIEALFPKTVPIGKQFGVILVEQGGHHFEVATFRSDAGYSDGRRPDAVIFTTAEEDAKRRDFTINGMFYDPLTEQVHDYVGGQKDLEAHLIRFIGDPNQRIKEDHLRLLRAVRFKNQFDFQYEPATYAAVKAHASAIKERVSTERIRDEISKMLLDKTRPSLAFNEMSQLGLLELILPELERLHGCAQPYEYHHEGDVWTHTMAAIDTLPPEAPLVARLATLFHDIGKPDTFALKERIRFDSHAEIGGKIATQIMRRLNFPREQIEAVSWSISHHMMMTAFLEMNDGRLMHWFHNPAFPHLLTLMKADAEGTTPSDLSLYNKIENLHHLKMAEHPELPKPLLSGEEIMEITGLPAGPKIGEIKTQLLEAQIDQKIVTRKQAEQLVKAASTPIQ